MNDQPRIPAISQILHPVTDVAAAAAFYLDTLGFATKFVDGARYAALDANGVTLALVGQDEDVTDNLQAPGVKVADVHATVAVMLEHGGTVVVPASPGPHELRAVVRDPWGNTLVLFQPMG